MHGLYYISHRSIQKKKKGNTTRGEGDSKQTKNETEGRKWAKISKPNPGEESQLDHIQKQN